VETLTAHARKALTIPASTALLGVGLTLLGARFARRDASAGGA